uniref:(California timema) hypothetical protein n=1 Tax=Timema californicum TaxID=61474 RepID=A0A7R9PBH3_TIMCA|nr:unnamed protein product [Timema californicum]
MVRTVQWHNQNWIEQCASGNFHPRRLKRLVGADISICKRGRSLSLQKNQIGQIESSAFIALENLKSLDLSHNQLTVEAIRADVLRGPPNTNRYEPLGLISLDLGYNSIHSLDPNAFEHLPYLKEIHLNNNPMHILDIGTQHALSSPEALEVLDLATTGISYIEEEFFYSASIKKSLKSLFLNGNQFTQTPVDLSVLGPSLEELNFNDNPVVELNDRSFMGLHKMRELRISGMKQLKRVGPATFDHLISLQVFYCSFNPQLTDIDKDAFRALRQQWPIKEMYVHNNGLKSLSEELVPWSQVEVIDLQENPWHCDCKLAWVPSVLGPIIKRNLPLFGQQIYCQEPSQWRGVSLLSLGDDSEVCVDQPEHLSSEGLHSSIWILLTIALTIVAGVGLTLLYKLYKRPPPSPNIVYSHIQYCNLALPT